MKSLGSPRYPCNASFIHCIRILFDLSLSGEGLLVLGRIDCKRGSHTELVGWVS